MTSKTIPLTFPFSFASSTISFRTPTIPLGLTLLILDTLNSPGVFLLTTFIASALKGSTAADGGGKIGGSEGKRAVVLVGLGEGERYWEGVCKKVGIPLATHRASNQFAFVSPPRMLFDDPSSKSLKPLFDSIQSALISVVASGPSSQDKECKDLAPLFVIDDLTSLLWSGCSTEEVERFLSTVRGLQRDFNFSLVILFHADLTSSAPRSPFSEVLIDPDLLDEHILRTRLIPFASLILRTRSLGSAHTGEMVVMRGPAYVDDPDIEMTEGGEKGARQYRLEEGGGISWIRKGLDSGFL